MAADDDKETFSIAGPTHLTVVDWDNEQHRRSVAASLVAGVYILDRDRHENRYGANTLAPPWWEFFHFRLIRQLVDDSDHSIFGAIFEFEPKTSPPTRSNQEIPRYVIAFRGTITKGNSVSRDLELDLHLIRNGLHRTTRVEIATQAVRNTVASSQNSNIWLTGHSLGAAMAMIAGKNMAATGTFLEAFLFNPPFFSAPIERIKDEKVKHGLRVAGSVITAGLAIAMSVKKPQQRNRAIDTTFTALSQWVPNLYVHPGDHICSEYIGYFEHRKNMEKLGIGGIGKLATQHSLGGLVMTALGKGADADPIHLLPSACLNVNKNAAPDFKKAHALQQWWQPEVNLQTQVHLYS